MLATSYYQEQKFQDAAPLLHDAAMSHYAPPEQAKQWLTAVMGIYCQEKNYHDTSTVGQELIKRGVTDSSIYTTIALALQGQGKNNLVRGSARSGGRAADQPHRTGQAHAHTFRVRLQLLADRSDCGRDDLLGLIT